MKKTLKQKFKSGKATVWNFNKLARDKMNEVPAGSPGATTYPTCDATKPGDASCVIITCPKTFTCPKGT